jgi:hypothetical protein
MLVMNMFDKKGRLVREVEGKNLAEIKKQVKHWLGKDWNQYVDLVKK